MRVLLLSNLYPPHVQGGAELAARDIASGLQMCGHDVMVLTSWWGLPAAVRDGNVSRTLRYSPAPAFTRQLSPAQQLHCLRDYYQHYHCSANQQELQRVLATFKPDVLYIWEVTGLGVCSLLRLLSHIRISVVFQLESYWYQYARSPQTVFSRLKLRWLKRLLIGSVPRLHYTSLIATSHAVKERYTRAGCDPARIEVIYNCVHPSFVQTPLSSREQTMVGEVQLLYAGRLCAEKGILILLKALDLLINQQGFSTLHLHLCGDGDATFLQILHGTLAKYRLTHVVSFHGKVSQDELCGYYDRAAMLLVPSLWQEPFGLVVVEAMARGLPVIASRVGGPAEILSHDQNGLLIAPDDACALAAAITTLVEQPELRRQLGDVALAGVHQHFAHDRIVRKIEHHLLKSISDSVKEVG